MLVAGEYLYGLNAEGGTVGKGTLFRLRTDGSGNIEILRQFDTEGQPGGNLYARSALAIEGEWLYGTLTDWEVEDRHGAVFRIRPEQPDTFAVLHTFTGADGDGSKPAGPLAVATDDDDVTWVYGTTLQGGANDAGALWRVSAAEESEYAAIDSFSTDNPVPLGLSHDNNVIYGATQGNSAGSGAMLFTLVEIVPFEIFITSNTRNPDEVIIEVDGLGGDSLTLSWQVQAAPVGTVCTAGSIPQHTGWHDALGFELTSIEGDEDGKLAGSGTTENISAGLTPGLNTFSLSCTNGEETRTAEISITAVAQSPINVSLNGIPVSTSQINLNWTVGGGVGTAGGTCTASSDPSGLWSETFAIGSKNSELINLPSGSTGTQAYSFTLSCTRAADGSTDTETVEFEIMHPDPDPEPDPEPEPINASSGGGALSPALLLLLMLTGMARHAAQTPRRQRA